MVDEYIPDRFELEMRRLTVEETLVELAHKIAELFDLNPVLVDAVEYARGEDDPLRIVEAMHEVLRAARKAQGLL
jgi:hypothetical protein